MEGRRQQSGKKIIIYKKQTKKSPRKKTKTADSAGPSVDKYLHIHPDV